MNTLTRKRDDAKLPSLRSWFEEAFGDLGWQNRLPEVFRQDFVPPLNVAETEQAFVITVAVSLAASARFPRDAQPSLSRMVASASSTSSSTSSNPTSHWSLIKN